MARRGTAALAAALAALDLPSGTGVVFPAVMCSIPVWAAVFAGWRPLFVDVNPANGHMDREDLARVLREPGVGAVVPVYMFGQPDQLGDLRALCRSAGVRLLEDLALALGGQAEGIPLGQWGDGAVVSFVRKTLPLEMGGAFLTDDADWARRARAFLAAQPYRPVSEEVARKAMAEFHAETARCARSDWRVGPDMESWQKTFSTLLLSSTRPEDWTDSVVLTELDNLEFLLQSRRVRAEVFETVFHHPRLDLWPREGSALFALPLRLAGVEAEAFRAFSESQGFSFRRISYPDIHPLFGPLRALPGARQAESEWYGIPLDETQPVSELWGYAEDFQSCFAKFLESGLDQHFDARGCLAERMSRGV